MSELRHLRSPLGRRAARLGVLSVLALALLGGTGASVPTASANIGVANAVFHPTYPGAVQTYTVPSNVNYMEIEAVGGPGGGAYIRSDGYPQGFGADMQGDFDVTPGETLSIIVGDSGQTDSGGGGTFVWSGTGPVSTSNLLLVAGGGGGGCLAAPGLYNVSGSSASLTTDGNPGGSGGNGGAGGPASTYFLAEYFSTLGGGGGGAGILTGGGDGVAGVGSFWGYAGLGGQAISLGGAGGPAVPPSSFAGGFGGGGSGGQYGGGGPADAVGAGGGGGGYSGGDGGAGGCGGGGGGGSYNGGANQVNTLARSGGEVAIAWLQKITFTTTPNHPVYGGTYTVAATGGGSGQPVVFTIDSSSDAGVCSISGSTVSFTGVGECVIDANQDGINGTQYFPPADQVQQAFYVSPASQTITLGPNPPNPVYDSSWTPTATGGASGNPVVFSVSIFSTPGVCTIQGGTVTFTGVGYCTIAADQAGNANYAPAPEVLRSYYVNPATPDVEWNPPATIPFGTPLGSPAAPLDATATISGPVYSGDVPGEFTYTPPAGTILPSGPQTLQVTFTPSDTADYYSISLTRDVTVLMPPGLWVVSKNGAVIPLGGAPSFGSLPTGPPAWGPPPPGPVAGMASTPDGQGYWLVSERGRLSSFGDASSYCSGSCGSLSGRHEDGDGEIVGIAADSADGGYWLASEHGTVTALGGAASYGSLPTGPRAPRFGRVTAIAATPDGGGYWLVSDRGTVAALGDATAYCGGSCDSLPSIRPPNGPIVGIAANGAGSGYWLLAADGTVFALDGAPDYGSLPSQGRHDDNRAIAIVATPDSNGYWIVTEDAATGFGDALSYPIPASRPPVGPIAGAAAP